MPNLDDLPTNLPALYADIMLDCGSENSRLNLEIQATALIERGDGKELFRFIREGGRGADFEWPNGVIGPSPDSSTTHD